MRFTTRMFRTRFVRSLSALAIVAAPACVYLCCLMPSEGAGTPAGALESAAGTLVGANEIPGGIDPASVAGSTACVECHKSEIGALVESKHHESMKLIQGGGGNIPKYADAAGVAVADVTKDSICSHCHGTPHGAGGALKAISGVSCESCHGGSKGNPEWLKLHATKGITREQREACDKAGMIRAPNIYGIAKNCAGCHVVSHADLVNAGHPVTTKWDFELVGGSSGEVRHNFQVDQQKNAEAPSLWLKLNPGASAENRKRLKYVVGMLVDLEMTLACLKDVPKNGGKTPFAKGHAKRLKALAKDFGKVADELGGDAPGEIKKAQAAIEAIGRISSFNWKKQDEAKAAHPIVAEAAESIAAGHDGSKLGAVDGLIKKNAKPRGDVYSP